MINPAKKIHPKKRGVLEAGTIEQNGHTKSIDETTPGQGPCVATTCARKPRTVRFISGREENIVPHGNNESLDAKHEKKEEK